MTDETSAGLDNSAFLLGDNLLQRFRDTFYGQLLADSGIMPGGLFCSRP